MSMSDVCCHFITQNLPPDSKKDSREVSKVYSLVYLQFYHSSGDHVMAVTKMHNARKRYPSSLDLEALNILTELLNSLNFREAFQVKSKSRNWMSLPLYRSFLIFCV